MDARNSRVTEKSGHITIFCQDPPSPSDKYLNNIIIINNNKTKQQLMELEKQKCSTPSPPALLRQDVTHTAVLEYDVDLEPPILTPDSTPTKDKNEIKNTSASSDSSVLDEHSYASPPAKEIEQKDKSKASKRNNGQRKRTGQSGAKKRVTSSKKTFSGQSPAAAKTVSRRAKAIQNNSKVTDFFPVRRSNRKTAKELMREKQHYLEQAIIKKCEHGLKVVEIPGKGRGVISTKPFEQGDFVVEYAGDLITLGAAKDRECHYSLSPETGCYMYYFKHNNKNYCVDATAESGKLGRLLNHSRFGNCCTKVVDVEGVPRLILVAARDIEVGEELLYDYGDRSKESVEAHPWLAL